MSITYNPQTGRYVGADGRFVPASVIANLLDQEQAQTAVRLKALTRLLIDQKITLSDWEQRFAQTLKESNVRALALGAGGKARLTQRHYGSVGYQLQQQYKYLDNFAQQLSGQKLTEAQAIRRSGLYASSVRVTFNRSEQISREAEGFNEARRSLDPQAMHCDSCLVHSTNGLWIPADQVVPAGVDCECGQWCRCTVTYRRRPASALNQPGILAP
jgi:hypothetical protein